MAGLRTLRQRAPNAQLFAISREGPDTGRRFLEALSADGNGAFDYPLLTDEGSVVIDQYAIRDPAYAGTENDGIPHPSVFVLDRDGRIVWQRVESDYRQRPSIEEIVEAVDRLNPNREP